MASSVTLVAYANSNKNLLSTEYLRARVGYLRFSSFRENHVWSFWSFQPSSAFHFLGYNSRITFANLFPLFFLQSRLTDQLLCDCSQCSEPMNSLFSVHVAVCFMSVSVCHFYPTKNSYVIIFYVGWSAVTNCSVTVTHSWQKRHVTVNYITIKPTSR